MSRPITPPPTDKRFHDPSIKNTPTISRRTHGTIFHQSLLADRRLYNLLDNNGKVILVSPEYFFNAVIPLVSTSRVDTVIEGLQAAGLIVDGRWCAFPQDPSKSRKNEIETFNPLIEITDAIATLGAGKDRASLVTYESNPYAIPYSSLRQNSTHPDGYFILKERNGNRWIDISVTAEFKKANGYEQVTDNINKMVWSLLQASRDDARKRCTFGFTIEDTDMRCWYWNRGTLLVTEPFNFITEELGWDTTMKRLKTDPNVLDITVRSATKRKSVYRTIKMLSDYRTDSLVGRGTRVWEAVRLEKGQPVGPHCALKDVWVEVDRRREGDILRDILDTDTPTKDLKKFFFTVNRDGDVLVQDGRPDDTFSVMMRGQLLPDDVLAFDLTPPAPAPILSESSKMATGSPAAWEEVKVVRMEPSLPCAKRHYRIVFKEVCKPIWEETSLHTIFQKLGQAVYALNMMHTSGWVHRDVSTSNILIDATGRARLADVEHARHTHDTSSMHPVRTGNADFMAVEVAQNQYLFRSKENIVPQRIESNPKAAPCLSTDFDDPSSSQKSTLRVDTPPPPVYIIMPKFPEKPTATTFKFWYNSLHDMESIIWIVLYFVVKRSLVIHDNNFNATKQNNLAALLVFSNSTARQEFLKDATLRLLSDLHPSVHAVTTALSAWVAKLVSEYEKVEKDISSISHLVANGLCTLIHQDIRTICQMNQLCDVQIVPVRRVVEKRDGDDSKENCDIQARTAAIKGS
ncbi:hypothetical protein PHLCEN_2v3244 [Hermanssonia centrifuga]|uniref:Fungal-type protein kinase domain-containing protein n=1 Tax=Hermanssonia centrifuga TaxID=98765 RepID=A0A2R6QXJ4_9APHY|nr:hypothetical protein PHLCEN_2v3244 [Hermanssonia centrifuga]